MKLSRFAALAAAALCAATLSADYRYEETSKVTGGAILRMSKFPGMGKLTAPTTTTHFYKGGKSAAVTGSRIDIIDADRGVFTVVNLDEKTYSTITFEEFKAALEALSKKGQQQARMDGEISFDMKVRDLGTSKVVLNQPTKGVEVKVTMTMKDKKSGQTVPMDILSEMYMAKELPGSREMREFQMRMAQKISWDVSNARFLGIGQMQPGFSEGMQKLSAEAKKIEGTPLMTITRMMGMMGGAGMGDMPEISGPGAADVNDAAARAARDEAAREAAIQTSRASGGRFGGLAGAAAGGMLGGLGRKKQSEQPTQPRPSGSGQQAASGPQPFMEVTSEVMWFSTKPIEDSQFEVPAGFKEVEHEMKKVLRGK
ncbi:MAG: hypothetical protein HXY18_13475 [Bryobacteraceae bacterium]|nr:hypothetical protein [Bryobacteraceae bacterium]